MTGAARWRASARKHVMASKGTERGEGRGTKRVVNRNTECRSHATANRSFSRCCKLLCRTSLFINIAEGKVELT